MISGPAVCRGIELGNVSGPGIGIRGWRCGSDQAKAARRRERNSNKITIITFTAFHASPFRKAILYDSVMSKITPEIQPPNDMPSKDTMITMPTRVAASFAGIVSRTMMA